MNARLWTHGWDFYTPGETIVYHLWNRSYRNNFREIEIKNKKKIEMESINRVKYILKIIKNQEEINLNEIEKYNLGNKRTIEEYQNYCGINFVNQTIEERAKYGGLDKNFFLNHIFDLINYYT